MKEQFILTILILFIELNSCTFPNWSSTKNGGFTAILNSKRSMLKSICIFYYYWKIKIYMEIYILHYELNFISDFNPYLSEACWFICSHYIITSNDNVSHSLTNY